MVYYVIFVIALIASILAKREADKWNRKSLVALFFVVIYLAFEIPAAIRYDVGTDYMFRYVSDYQDLVIYGTEPTFEQFFVSLFHFIYSSNISFQWFFVITSSIINLCFILAIAFDKKHEYPIGISIYFLDCIYLCSLSNIRQFTGIAICVLAFSITLNFRKSFGKYFISLILLALSVFCHKSCIIYIPLYLFFLFRPRGRIMALITLIPLILSPFIVRFAINWLGRSDYSYFLTNYIKYGRGVAQIALSLPEIFMFILSFHKIFFTKEGRKDYHVYMTYTFNILAFISYLVAYVIKSNELYLRIYHIFYAFHIILVPYFINAFKKTENVYVSIEKLVPATAGAKVNVLQFSSLNLKKNPLMVSNKGVYVKAKTLTRKTNAFYVVKVILYLLYIETFWMQAIYSPIYGVFPYQTIYDMGYSLFSKTDLIF